jgi:hypothetical protein
MFWVWRAHIKPLILIDLPASFYVNIMHLG